MNGKVSTLILGPIKRPEFLEQGAFDNSQHTLTIRPKSISVKPLKVLKFLDRIDTAPGSELPEKSSGINKDGFSKRLFDEPVLNRIALTFESNFDIRIRM